MRRGLAALAVGWICVAGCVWAQTGYQSQPIAPDPALKTTQTPESVLMRAAYEARHQDCVDAGKHLDDVQQARPLWAPVFAARLICARSEGKATDERTALDALTALQPGYWLWWRDSAMLHAKAAELQAAESDVGRAITLRPWDAALYGLRSDWRERLRNYTGAYEDAARMHDLQPALGAPLERMAQLAERAGHSAAEAQQEHALAELNPENLPLAVRDDSELPMAKMQLQEMLLRANYAVRVDNHQLALRLVQAILQRWPKTAAALEMYYPLWKRGVVDLDVARDAMTQLVQLPPDAGDAGTRPRAARPAGTGGRATARSSAGNAPAAPLLPDYYRWLLEMGASDAEQQQLYRLLIAADPYDAKNYADLAAVQLTQTPQHGAREPSLPTDIPSAPTTRPANSTTGRGTPLPGVLTGVPQNQENLPPANPGGTAEANYQLAITLDPSVPAYYYGLAQALDRRSAFPLEIMALNMALTGDPDNADYKAARAKLP